MKAVNAASHTLSNIGQSGWKRSSSVVGKDKQSQDVKVAATDAAKHLKMLRDMCSNDIDVERAAMSILGKLVTLEMYEEARFALEPIHACLCSIHRVSTELTGMPKLLSIPIPSSTLDDATLLTLTSTYFAHAFSIVAYHTFNPPKPPSKQTNIGILAGTLSSAHRSTLLEWIPVFSASLEAKQLDPVLSRAYSVLTKACATATSSPSSQSSPDPSAIFQLRMFAVQCLLNTSPGIVEPSTFWDQVVKFAAVYTKAKPPAPEEDVLKLVLGAFDRLYIAVKEGVDEGKERFTMGRGWVEFLEYWMSFAKKAGDIRLVDRIAGFLKATSSPSSAAPSPQSGGSVTSEATTNVKASSAASGTSSAVNASQLFAAFTQVTTVLEQKGSDVIQRLQDVSAQLHTSRHLPQLLRLSLESGQKEEEISRTGHKVDRALERLRRATVIFLESTKAGDEGCTVSSSVLRGILDLYKPICLELPKADILNRAIDTCFVLAKNSLIVTDARTYVPAHEFLACAAALVKPLSPEQQESLNVANFLRCISGAYHNLGGSLYQAERYGGAVGFLKDACSLGSQALEMRRAGSIFESMQASEKEKEKESKTDEGWKQLEEQIYRRWELLGVCHSKIGERKEARQSFVQAILSFPYEQSGISSMVNGAGATDLSTFWNSSSSTKSLGSLVDRVTYMGACELLLPGAVISLSSNDTAHLPVAVVGILLERQIDSLEPSRHKEPVVGVLAHLLVEILKIYRSDNMPLRRIRVLLRCLELTYHIGSVGFLRKSVGNLEEITGEIFELLKAKELAQDQYLSRLHTQYEATTYLWLALHAHRQPQITASQIQVISQHAETACSLLRIIISPKAKSPRKSSTPRKFAPRQITVTKTSPLVPAPSTRQRLFARSAAKKTPASSGSRARTRTTLATTAAIPDPLVADPIPPVTPAREGRKTLQPLSMNTRTPPKATSLPEEIKGNLVETEKVVFLLELVAQISGLLGLAITKIRVLEVTRKLCEQVTGSHSDACIIASVDLAREFIAVGKTKRAANIFNHVSNAVRSGAATSEARILFLLRFAECLARQGILDSAAVYLEALELSDDWDLEAKGSSIQRIHARVKSLEFAATAAQVYAWIQACKDNVPASISAMLQSLRLWTRATEALSRLAAPPVGPSLNEDDENPFHVSKPSTPMTDSQIPADKVFSHPQPLHRRSAGDPIEWRVSEGLLSTLLSLCHAYLTRGSVREAEYFAQRARDLAQSLNAPPMVARALTKMAEIQLLRGDLEASLRHLERAGTMLEGFKSIDVLEVRRLQGLYHERTDENANANEVYEATTKMIEELDEMFIGQEASAFRRSSVGAPSSKEAILPHLMAVILRHQAWLLRDDAELHSTLLDKFQHLTQSIGAEAEQHALLARLTLENVYKRFHDDMFLSSLAESAIALPMGMSRAGDTPMDLPVQDVITTLNAAEEFYWTNLTLTFKQGIVADVRESLVSLALVQAFQTSLGKVDRNGAVLVASLLDASTAITLRREMLETIDLKFPASLDDDAQWPRIDQNGCPAPRIQRKSTSKSKFLRAIPPDSHLIEDDSSIKEFWASIKDRYQSHLADPLSFSTTRTVELPHNWTVIHISVTEDKGTLFLARQQGGGQQNPMMFRVPLKGRRLESDVDEGENLTFDDAIDELREIVRLSDQGTKQARHVKRDDPEARAAWWKERIALDSRLRSLLENIEFCWLGAFKTILSSRRSITASLLADLRSGLERVFRRTLHLPEKPPRSRSGHKKQASRSQKSGLDHVTFDDSLLECLATLSPKCKDEELEDLAYFILDLYQFHGVPVAIAEVDITQLVVDLRSALEDHSQRMTRQEVTEKDDEHLFLVLDRKVQGLPWENMPILRGRSVSRIPSLDFLLDRVAFSKWNQERQPNARPSHPGSAIINPRRGYFILNPSGDLRGTEGRFTEWVAGMKKAGWDGINGSPPSEQQFLNALKDRDLVVYFGHGGGEQYIRSHKIRTLPKCAATMLWGCSSGMLSEMGDFDRVGTPYHYMLSGCPTLVANLWDVTDKDIDKFSLSVFDKIHLDGESILTNDPGRGTTSIVEAVAQSRDVCKLKYLTGAAPVVYGIPFYL